MKAVAIVLGATLTAVVVWLSVAADVAALWRDAGYAAIAALAFPAFMIFAVRRGWGDGP